MAFIDAEEEVIDAPEISRKFGILKSFEPLSELNMGELIQLCQKAMTKGMEGLSQEERRMVDQAEANYLALRD